MWRRSIEERKWSWLRATACGLPMERVQHGQWNRSGKMVIGNGGTSKKEEKKRDDNGRDREEPMERASSNTDGLRV